MTREIKFRGWNELKKKMFEPFNLYGYVQGHLDYDKEVENFPVFSVGTIFLQFTGLKDKNGKEIYEGDILEWDNECNILIKWLEDRDVGFCYEVLSQKDKNIVGFDIRFYRSEENAKVIGNKFENPELLK